MTTVCSKETNTVFINVVNRHKDKAITADILNSSGEFENKAEAIVINNASLTDPFTYDKEEEYIPEAEEIKPTKNKVTYSFQPHSYTQIRVGIKKD